MAWNRLILWMLGLSYIKNIYYIPNLLWSLDHMLLYQIISYTTIFTKKIYYIPDLLFSSYTVIPYTAISDYIMYPYIYDSFSLLTGYLLSCSTKDLPYFLTLWLGAERVVGHSMWSSVHLHLESWHLWAATSHSSCGQLAHPWTHPHTHTHRGTHPKFGCS